jgi:hypothetical protein
MSATMMDVILQQEEQGRHHRCHGQGSLSSTAFDTKDVSLPSTLEAMRHQEESFYAIRGDYLAQRGNGLQEIAVDYGNRESMTEWQYKIVEFLDFSHETVEISMNYLNQFLLTPAGEKALACTKTFQLANMACLYLGIKCHEEIVLDSKFMQT